jgi:hypothetical protein
MLVHPSLCLFYLSLLRSPSSWYLGDLLSLDGFFSYLCSSSLASGRYSYFFV